MLVSGGVNNKGCKLLVSILLLSLYFSCSAQTEHQTIRISLDLKGVKLEEVIKIIESKTGLSFSFNPNRIPLTTLVTYQVTEKLLPEVLEDVFGPASVTFEFVEGKIILRPTERTTLRQQEMATLRGFIADESNGEALIGATVFLPELKMGCVSNAFGFYSITIPMGTYSVSFSYIGYGKIEKEIQLMYSTTQDVTMRATPPLLEEIVVTESTLSEELTAAQTSDISLVPAAISQRPSFFGETDAVKSLEMVPGVKMHSDGSTFYYVRGGDRDQNLILVDDAPVFNPNHLLGMFSTIVPEAINDINLYKGSMPASVGGRLSSILDIRTKKGNDQHFQASGSLGLLSSKLTLEGPIKRDRISYLISGRKSRLKWITNLIDEDIAKFQFYDLTGKLNYDFNDRNKLYFSFYNGSDDYFQSNSGISWTNKAGSLRWNHIFNDRLFLNTTLASGAYDYDLYTDLANQSRWHSHLANINLKTDFSFFVDPSQEIDFGLAIAGYNFNPGNFSSNQPVRLPVVSIKNSSELVLYGNHSVQVGEHMSLSYGLRLSAWSNQGGSFEFLFDDARNVIDTLFFNKNQSYAKYGNVEPRFSFSYQPDEISSFKFSYSRNVQNVHLISNSISPFTSFEVWLPSSINIKPQTSDQLAIGYYHSLPKGAVLEVEGFLKKMKNQIDYETHAETLLNPIFERELRFGEGNAHGVEILARKDQGQLRGMVGYSYSRAKRKFRDINEGRAYNAFYDRPHQFNALVSYDPTPRWNFGMNWSYSTGAPYSSPVSFYRHNDLEIPIYGQKNNSRLPDYHRMDMSATFTLNRNIENKFRHTITLSIYNLYGRKNTLFVNYNKEAEDERTYRVPADLLDNNRVATQFYLFRFTPSLTYNFKWR